MCIRDSDIKHRPGTRHGNADGLSRKPPDEDPPDEVRMLRQVRDASPPVGENHLEFSFPNENKDEELHGETSELEHSERTEESADEDQTFQKKRSASASVGESQLQRSSTDDTQVRRRLFATDRSEGLEMNFVPDDPPFVTGEGMRRKLHDSTKDEESLPHDAGDEDPEPVMDRDGAFVSQESPLVSMKHGFSPLISPQTPYLAVKEEPLISPQTFYAAVKEEEIDRRVMMMTTKESDENEDGMIMAQRKDLELGPIVNLRLLWDECPTR